MEAFDTAFAKVEAGADDAREAIAEDSDLLFLALLARKRRNYKSGCAICLTDEIMGTTCSCGHTEICVFRPCGHSACASPCFKAAFGEGKPRQITLPDGKTFLLPSQHDVSEIRNFACHMCRGNVDAVFRAENAFIKPQLLQLVDTAPIEAYLSSHLQEQEN